MAENAKNYEELIRDGDKALELGNREEAANLYQEAYKIKKTGRIAFIIFVWYISQSDYVTGLDWLLELRSFDKYINDFYTYALLLNNFVQLPDELIKELSNLEVKDLRITGKDFRFDDRDLNNKIRDAILNQNYRAAYGLAKRIVARGSIKPQEYVIYRLLNEKVIKEPKRLKKMVEEERFDDLCVYLNTKANYNNNDKLTMYLLNNIYNLLDGVVIDKKKKNGVTLRDAIYLADYSWALELCNNDIVLEALLKKAIEYNQINMVNKFKGDLGYYFYDTIEKIYYALNDKDYDTVKSKIKEYIGVIGRASYNNYLIGMVEVIRIMPEYQGDLINLLSDATYGAKVIDTNYLKKIFGASLNNHQYDVAMSLLHVFKWMGTQDDLNVEYLEFVFNREKYINSKIPYDTQVEDDVLTEKIETLVNEQVSDYQIKTIEAKDEHEEFVIEYVLESIQSSYYIKMPTEESTIYFVKRKEFTDSFRKDIVVTKVKTYINSSKYEEALEALKNGFTLSDGFDPVILSFVAYVYELIGNKERLEYINNILVKICGIDDYNEVINSDEVAMLDKNTNFVDYVKKLINKPIE